ncbi:MAG: T9SS type A sorting domain-containing protein [Chitinophagaceae bacterium]|nr:T9SS type A sorting domain-containing protein [Chitinophagaceae bacterium]
MKKLFLISFSLMLGLYANAQLSETFANVGALNTVTVGSGSWNVGGLPTGWTQYNGDAFTPYTSFAAAFGTNAWITREVTLASGAKDTIAVSTSYYTPVGVANDWLISPSFTPVAGSYLLFDALAQDGNYPDGFMVKVSTTGAAYTNFTTAPVLTVPSESATGWVTHAINLSAYVGMPINIAIINNSNDMYLLYLNNIRATTLPANDLSLVASTPSAASYKSYATVGGNVSVQGLVKNLGASTVTSYTVKLNDGTTTQSFPQTASLIPYTSTTFSLNYPMTSTGIKPIKMWVEYTGDAIHTNDSSFSEFGGATFTPVNTPVFEEATGTWCQWCPRGAVFMDSLVKVHPDVVAIAVHNSDPMTVATYDAGMGPLIGGYPSGLVGRKLEADPSDFLTEYTNHLADFGVADLTVVQPTLTGNTLQVKVDVKMAVSTKPSYDYRLALVVTSDDVHGTATSWNQANAYAGGANGVMGGFELLPSTVPAAQMYYDHVARDITGGFTGVSGSLPGTMTAGSTYSYTFNWTVPAGVELQKSKANVLLISGLSGEVQNGKWKGAFPTSVKDIVAAGQLNIFPNPSNDYLNLDFTLNATSTVTISMIDVTGKAVYNNKLSNLTGNQGLVINTSNLANGVYSLSLQTTEGTITRKVTIAH